MTGIQRLVTDSVTRLLGWLPSLILRPVMAVVVVASLATVGMGLGVLTSASPASAAPSNCGDTNVPTDAPSSVLLGGFTAGNVTLNLQKHEEAASTSELNPGTGYRQKIAPNTDVNGEFSYCTRHIGKGANTTAWYTIDNGTYVVKAKSEVNYYVEASAFCQIERNGTDTEVVDSPYTCRANVVTLRPDDGTPNGGGLTVAIRFYVSEKRTETIVRTNNPLTTTMQTQLLSQHCSDKNNPSCSYVVTTPPLAVYGPATQVGNLLNNCTSSPAERTFTYETTKSTEDNIGLTLTAGASFDAYIFKVSTSVSNTYSTKVSATQKFGETNKFTVKPGMSNVGVLRVRFDRVIGDFHLSTPTVNYVLKNVDWLFPTPVSDLTFREAAAIDCK